MHPNNLNNRSLHAMRMSQFMQEGGQPNMAAANPTIDQLLPAIKSALEQGTSLTEIIMGLAQQEVPMEIIAQAMQSIGVPEEEFAMAMQQLQGGPPQDQMAQQAPPMPPQGGPEGAPMDPAMEQAMMEQMANQGMPMAQEGTETGGNYEESLAYTGGMGEDAPNYDPVETVVTDHDKTYHYKEVYDPSTGETKYYSKDTRYKNPRWKDVGKQGDQEYDAISADVFGQNLENYSEGDPRRADFNKKLKKWEAEEAAKKKEPPSKGKVKSDLEKINNIDWSKYKVKVIQYPYGDEENEPGHIEMALYDPETGKIVNDHDGLATRVNRWMGKGYGNKNVSHAWDKGGKGEGYQKSRKIRTAILDLKPEQIKNFVLKSQDYMGTDYGTFEKTKTGRAYDAVADYFDEKIPWSNIPIGDAKNQGAYDFARSNCADGVCMSLGIPEDVEKNLRVGNITSPYKVFDHLIQNYDVEDVKNFRQPTEDEFVESLVDKYYPEAYKNMPGWAQTLIGPTISDKNRKKMVNFAKGLDLQKVLQDPGYVGQELGKFLLPSGGDNQAVKMLWEEGANEWIKDNTWFDLSTTGMDNVVPWWKNNVINPIGDWFSSHSGPKLTQAQIDQGKKDWEHQKMTQNVGWKGFEEGGSTGKYGDILKAQYGKGTTLLTPGLPPKEKPSSAAQAMVDSIFGEGVYKSGQKTLEDAQNWTEKHYQNFEPSKVLTDPVGAIDSVGKYWGWWQEGGEPNRYGQIVNRPLDYEPEFREGGSTRRLKRAQLGYGGGYTLPINMVEDYQESKPDIVAVDNMTPEQQSAYDHYMELVAKRAEEQAYVDEATDKLGQIAREAGADNWNWEESGIGPNLHNWFLKQRAEGKESWTCNTYSCALARKAGFRVPEGSKGYKEKQKPGDLIPIIPGNINMDESLESLGFELLPEGTLPAEAGDFIRMGMPEGRTGHSLISAGYGDDDVLDIYNNPGNIETGYEYKNIDPHGGMKYAEGDEGFYTDKARVARYVGALPYYDKQITEAKAAYDALLEGAVQDKQTGGTIPALFEGSSEGFGSQGATADPIESQIQYYFSLPTTMDGEPGPGGFGTVGEFKMAPKEQQMEWVAWANTQQNDQFTPGQMSPQNQQMMQLMEEVNSAKSGGKKYRTKSKQTESKKKGGSTDGAIELTTEQIAKIMAAGGNVKYL